MQGLVSFLFLFKAAILISNDHNVIELPSFYLPKGCRSGSMVNLSIKCEEEQEVLVI